MNLPSVSTSNVGRIIVDPLTCIVRVLKCLDLFGNGSFAIFPNALALSYQAPEATMKLINHHCT